MGQTQVSRSWAARAVESEESEEGDLERGVLLAGNTL